MEAIYSSDMPAATYQTTRCHNSEDHKLVCAGSEPICSERAKMSPSGLQPQHLQVRLSLIPDLVCLSVDIISPSGGHSSHKYFD
jgi:hypothetical protein